MENKKHISVANLKYMYYLLIYFQFATIVIGCCFYSLSCIAAIEHDLNMYIASRPLCSPDTYTPPKQLTCRQRFDRSSADTFMPVHPQVAFASIAPDSRERPTLRLDWNTVRAGLRHAVYRQAYDGYELKADILEVDPDMLEIRPVMPADTLVDPKTSGENAIGATASMRKMANKSNAIALVNGSFFMPNAEYYKTFVGNLIRDGKPIAGSTILRPTLGILSDGSVQIAPLNIPIQIYGNDGRFLTSADGLNQLPSKRYRFIDKEHYRQERGLWGETIIFTRDWSNQAPPIEANMEQIQITDGIITAVSHSKSLPIPLNGYVIVKPWQKGMFEKFALGDVNDYRIDLPGEWRGIQHAISGKPFLVKDGKINLDWQAENFPAPERTMNLCRPRTCAGVTKDGKLALVTMVSEPDVKGHLPFQAGPDLLDAAAFLRDIGVKNGINLDGGKTSTMIIDGRVISKSADPLKITSRPEIPDFEKDGTRLGASALGVFEKPHWQHTKHLYCPALPGWQPI